MILPEYKTESYRMLVEKIIAVLREAGVGAGLSPFYQGIHLYMPFSVETRKPGLLARLTGWESRTDLVGFLWLINEARSATPSSPVLDYTEKYFEQCKSAAEVLAAKTGLNIRLNSYDWDTWEIDREGHIHDKYPGGF